jgi:hypothetical protein
MTTPVGSENRAILSNTLDIMLGDDIETCLHYPEHLVQPNAWAGHIPFAFWLVKALRPRTLVELGVHTGNSYGAFCQAVQMADLPARCFGVDTWEGDIQAGFYNEQIYADLVAWHDVRFAGFSRLVRSTFDNAVGDFSPGSIDLLHIDGLHTYEAVRHDFNTWRSRLSRQAVVLLHDTNVRDRDFGVWHLWEELSEEFPSFEFLHSHGLGVLGIGDDLPDRLISLFDAARQPHLLRRTRHFFNRLGDPLVRTILLEATEKELHLERERAAEARTAATEKNALLTQHSREMQELRAFLTAARADVTQYQRESAQLATDVTQYQRESAQLAANVTQYQRESAQLATDMQQAHREIALLRDEVSIASESQIRLQRAYHLVTGSTTWKLTAPLRRTASAVPPSFRLLARRLVKGSYWIMTPWKMPDRIKFLRARQQYQYPTISSSFDRASANVTTTPSLEGVSTARLEGANEDSGHRRPAIECSALFDPVVYCQLHADIRSNAADPWTHFLQHGIFEGRRFITQELVARALSRWDAEIQNGLQAARDILGSELCEETFLTAAAPLASRGTKVGVYYNSQGNFYMQEIANLIQWQLKSLKIDAQLRTDESDLGETVDIRIFVAPHEFFSLGLGKDWRNFIRAQGSILFNVEQVQTPWFCAGFQFLLDAPLVLDINFHSAFLLRKMGCNAIHYMPPYLPECRYTSPQLDVSQIDVIRGYEFSRRRYDWTEQSDLSDRPIDILFIGTGCERRLSAIERIRELTDEYRFVCIYTQQSSPLNGENYRTTSPEINCALAQRSKVVLNLHRDWIGYFEWSRMVMQGFWQGACVVSDPGLSDPLFDSGRHFLEENVRHIPDLLRWLLGTPDGQAKMNQVGAAAHDRARSSAARAGMLLPMLKALNEISNAGTLA